MNNELIQFIDIIHYRFEKSEENSSEKFLNFKPRINARSPSEILSYLVDVINYGLGILKALKPTETENSTLDKINENFNIMKSYLSENQIEESTSAKLINGPLSDTLTHIGQLTLLRRLKVNPIEWENYTNANT